MISVLSETQERFFLAIGKQLPLDRIIEIHLFQPMRQGGIESGVAVVAAVPEGEALLDDAGAPGTPGEGDVETVVANDDSAADVLERDDDDDDDGDADLGDAGEGSDNAGDHDDGSANDEDESLDAEGHDAPDDVDRAMDDVEESEEGELRRRQDGPVESVHAPEAVIIADASAELPDETAEQTLADDDVTASDVRARRYTVYTAHYRHVLKGPDRGKWEVSVVAEADAPLLTVDVVVRGVLRRAGDAGEPERLSGDEMRKALRQTTAPVAPAARAGRR